MTIAPTAKIHLWAKIIRDGGNLSVGEHSQIDEVRSGGSYYSQNDLRVHFGLGKASVVDLLEIRWPSGHVDRFTKLRVDRILTIKEGSGS